jgi:hypothetical protein
MNPSRHREPRREDAEDARRAIVAPSHRTSSSVDDVLLHVTYDHMAYELMKRGSNRTLRLTDRSGTA